MISVQFLNHIMISLGRYETGIDMSPHGSIREQFLNEKTIGINDYEEYLQIYSNELCK